MIIDTLTIAGFVSAASFLLMPLLMGREFIRVQDCDEPAGCCPAQICWANPAPASA